MTKQTFNVTKSIFFFVIVSISILAKPQFYQLFYFINASIVLSMSVDETQCFSSPLNRLVLVLSGIVLLNANFLGFSSL